MDLLLKAVECREKLDKFATLVDGWYDNHFEGKKIDPRSMGNALDVLLKLYNLECVPDFVEPLTDGGICFEFYITDNISSYLDFNEDKIRFCIDEEADTDGRARMITVDEIDKVVEEIKEYEEIKS